jgi:hypothetical protein
VHGDGIRVGGEIVPEILDELEFLGGAEIEDRECRGIRAG